MTAARRHAGGAATATRAAMAKTARKVEAFANMVSGVFCVVGEVVDISGVLEKKDEWKDLKNAPQKSGR